MTTILNLDPITKLTRSQFYQLCLANPDLLLELSPRGELIIIPPLGGENGSQQANLIASVGIWNQQSQLGIVFSSQTIFSLPGGGSRAPDASWVELSRWEALSEEEKSGFPPISIF